MENYQRNPKFSLIAIKCRKYVHSWNTLQTCWNAENTQIFVLLFSFSLYCTIFSITDRSSSLRSIHIINYIRCTKLKNNRKENKVKMTICNLFHHILKFTKSYSIMVYSIV